MLKEHRTCGHNPGLWILDYGVSQFVAMESRYTKNASRGLYSRLRLKKACGRGTPDWSIITLDVMGVDVKVAGKRYRVRG
jgi:hypothetical protein